MIHKLLPLAFAAASFGMTLPARAQNAAAYPVKTITIVVPTAPGGANDAISRTLGQKMSTLLGQSVIIDNRAGANGAIAAEYVAHAAPDGYTLMYGYIGTHAMNPALQKLRYDPVTDFEPIGMVGYSPTILVANPKVPVKDAKDLVAQLKAKPDSYTYASAGNGTAPQFAAELFKLSTGVVMLGVPYKGSGPAMTDTIGGQTQFMFPSLFGALPHVRDGRLRALAVAGPKRLSSLPGIPTLQEIGIKDVDVTQWYGLFAPAKTPAAIIQKLNSVMNQALADKVVAKRLEESGADVKTSTPAEFGQLVKSELVKWKRVVVEAHLTSD